MIWVVEGNGEGDLLDGHVLLQYVVGVDQKTVMWGGTNHTSSSRTGRQPGGQAGNWDKHAQP